MTSAALRKLTLIAAAITLVAVFAACGDDSTTNPPGGGTFNGTVQVNNNVFSPASATVHVGDTVTWKFNGFHSVTAPPPGGSSDFTFDSGQKSSGTFQFAFNAEGVAHYYCTVHGTSMSGTITVKP